MHHMRTRSEADGSKPRSVLITREQAQDLFENLA